MLPTTDTIFECSQELAAQAVLWLDETALGALFLVAFVLRMVADRLPHSRIEWGPRAASGVFLLAYFLHRYSLDGDQFECLVLSLLRSFVASHIVLSVTELTMLVVRAAWGRIDRLRRSLARTFLGFLGGVIGACRRVGRWRWPRKPPPSPPTTVTRQPTLAEVLRQRAQAAQAEYDAEIAALSGLPLDDDEREMLQNMAKQRLLSRLRPKEEQA